jgi:hypothetical protein
VLEAGLGACSETQPDKFEIAGFKVNRIQIMTLRPWLQVWDMQIGWLLGKCGAEGTDAAQLLAGFGGFPGRSRACHDARRRRMVENAEGASWHAISLDVWLWRSSS